MSEEMNNEMIEDVDAAATEDEAGAQPQEDGQEQPKKYTDADVDKIVARKIAAERKRVAKLAEAEQQESEYTWVGDSYDKAVKILNENFSTDIVLYGEELGFRDNVV